MNISMAMAGRVKSCMKIELEESFQEPDHLKQPKLLQRFLSPSFGHGLLEDVATDA